ncbi:MAG: CIA30 family protein [Gemmatimonadota bacterium]|jgi:monofunctional biosynthetic peptidoglycan transglycosylase
MRFRTLPLALLAALSPSFISAQEADMVDMKVLIDFTSSDAVRWTIVNDGVMGGLSRSELEPTDSGTAIFSGFVSLENNGGFASVRASFGSLDLSPFAGVMVRVRGDGRRYQLRFRTDNSFDGVAYRAEFDAPDGEWVEVKLPFSGFQPTFRGRVPRGAAPLDPGRIRQLGFLIGDKREGSFEMEIDWVKAYRD